MKIFILDKFKITKFNLPEKVEDSFLIPYNGYNNKNDNVVTVEANNDKWQLKSNGNVNIIDGTNLLDSVILENYSYYSLKILGQNEYGTLFAMPSKDEETYKLDFKNLKSITIGSSPNTNIYYRNNLTSEIHAEIKFVNNEWYLAGSADDSFRTYVNGERVLTAKLNTGDVIFINGLKIIWMKSFLKINNPKQTVSVTGLSAFEELDVVDNTKYTPVTDEEANVDLYDEDDYFYHMPRLVPTVNPVEIEIDAPPSGDHQEELPLLLTLGSSLTMATSSLMMGFTVISSVSSGKRTWLDALPQIITMFAMIFGSLIMPRITKAYQKKQKKKKEAERQTKYKAYLDKMDTKIQYALKQETQILKENNLSTKDCYDVIQKRNRNFWSREITDEDFLRVRLGIGNIRSFVTVKAPQEHFSMDTDNLQELVYEVDKKSKTLNDVPVTVNLTDQTILSFVFNSTYRNDYMNGIITQLLALHSATELKLVILTTKENEKRWEFAKFLPHCWSDDKSSRFFATNSEELKEVSNYLEEEYRKRHDGKSEGQTAGEDKNKKFKDKPPYYLVITDNYKAVKNTPIIDMIQKNPLNVGFSFITISNSMKNLPNKCEKFVEIGEKESCILEKRLSSESQIVFVNEYEKNLDMNAISVRLSNVPLLTKDGLSILPTSLSFLDMYGVGKIEQLNILNRWQTNNPVATLSTPIGVHADGEQFKLDLHEKFHGPHGLIAGSTGSGKSEFIITYILSMCVNYHPYEVQFVLIDYKGGGLAGAFENKETGVKVPHLVGTITNLDTAEMNRTLVSISSELKRRQRKFNEVKDKLDESTMDIYKYQKLYREGMIEEPMAHLFIISDEFAELKSQQPEFLAELVSTARIGRSLGVHLILATQKPSGVVNDQIWSNSKFKVCLKVQDRSDSMEMLKRPEAASIKETGRFYLQVGYDDYFDIGQSGWGGAKYVPTDRIIKKVDDSINFVNNTGNVIKSVNDIAKKETTEDLGEQLTNIVKYIHNLGIKENIVTQKMWLDKIPDVILLNDVKQKYNYKPTPYLINPVIGEYDNPAAQSQGLLNLNLSDGNTVIYGKGGSGKENLLSTILWSTSVEHTPDEVSFYIIDCGAEVLKMFYKFPHIGEIATVDEQEKIINILSYADEEIERRKDAYADYAGSYKNYCENSGNKDPLLIFIINNYEIFSETYSKIAESIQTMYRDGSKYGIHFILTCTTTNSVRMRTTQYFNNKIALQLADGGDYRGLVGAPKGLVPAKSFGRGIISKDDTGYEFQTANITDLKQLNNVIKDAAGQLNAAYTTRAKKIRTVPNVVTLNDVIVDNMSLSNLPIGYDINTKEIHNYNFTDTKFNIVIGNDLPTKFNFIMALIKQISKLQNINFKIVDFVDAFDGDFAGVKVIKNNFDNEIAMINNEIVNEKKSNATNVYMIVGASGLTNKLTPQGKQIVNNLFIASNTFERSFFIFVDNYSDYKNLQLEPWYQSQVDATNGIWLGTEAGSQMSINISNLTLEDKKIEFDFMGLAVKKGSHTIIKYVVDTGDEHEK